LEAGDVEKIPDFDALSVDHGLTLLGNASNRLRTHGDLQGSKIVQLNAIRFLVHKGEGDEARDHLQRLERDWPLLLNDSQLQKTKKWFLEQYDADVANYLKTELRSVIFRAKRLLRRVRI
jgi:hypothetical protein